ncbi:MAG: type II toxin-antitoxin system VapC family toxin [Anaerolineae bacterium]|nr:type II toxin-antitoxin system VapC family toxin [Anaerolineae bacterium]
MTETFVLDSFAVLALLGREPGSQKVADLLRKAQDDGTRVLMTWVNAGEVAYIVERRWGAERLYAALAVIEATALEIVSVERELALMAAHIKAEHAVAYADAFAVALAEHRAAKLVTGDPEFKRLEGILDIHWLPQREP